MPAKDRHHDAVIRALTKSGWQVTDQQITLVVATRRLWIDIRADKSDEQLAVLIEVKGFERTPSPIEYLASAIGKYLLYRTMLDDAGIDILLYMAVPKAAYNGILGEKVGRRMVEKFEIRLLIFDPVQENILQWIPNL